MWKTVRIILMMWVLAWVSIGSAHASTTERRDRLRCDAVSEQQKPQAIVSDSQSSCRLVPVRTERVQTPSQPSVPPTGGRTAAALYSTHHLSIGSIAAPCRMASEMLLSASRTLSFIVLRHIVR